MSAYRCCVCTYSYSFNLSYVDILHPFLACNSIHITSTVVHLLYCHACPSHSSFYHRCRLVFVNPFVVCMSLYALLLTILYISLPYISHATKKGTPHFTHVTGHGRFWTPVSSILVCGAI